jgi:hypothetical protein
MKLVRPFGCMVHAYGIEAVAGFNRHWAGHSRQKLATSAEQMTNQGANVIALLRIKSHRRGDLGGHFGGVFGANNVSYRAN